SEEGLVVVVATIDMQKRQIIAGPDLLSRGFIYMRESGDLINQGRRHLYRSIKRELKNDKLSEAQIKNTINSYLQKFFFEQKEKHPIVLPKLVKIIWLYNF